MRPPSSCPPSYDSAAFLAGSERAGQLLESGAPRDEVLTALVQALETACNHEVVGAILLLDHENRLRHGAAPSLPANYNRAIDGIPAGPYGTCCAAAHRNEIVITPDIESDPGWAKLKDYPLAIRLRAAWSCPIRATDGRVLGTFGTYFRECRVPTDAERAMVITLAQMAATAIARHAQSSRPPFPSASASPFSAGQR